MPAVFSVPAATHPRAERGSTTAALSAALVAAVLAVANAPARAAAAGPSVATFLTNCGGDSKSITDTEPVSLTVDNGDVVAKNCLYNATDVTIEGKRDLSITLQDVTTGTATYPTSLTIQDCVFEKAHLRIESSNGATTKFHTLIIKNNKFNGGLLKLELEGSFIAGTSGQGIIIEGNTFTDPVYTLEAAAASPSSVMNLLIYSSNTDNYFLNNDISVVSNEINGACPQYDESSGCQPLVLNVKKSPAVGEGKKFRPAADPVPLPTLYNVDASKNTINVAVSESTTVEGTAFMKVSIEAAVAGKVTVEENSIKDTTATKRQSGLRAMEVYVNGDFARTDLTNTILEVKGNTAENFEEFHVSGTKNSAVTVEKNAISSSVGPVVLSTDFSAIPDTIGTTISYVRNSMVSTNCDGYAQLSSTVTVDDGTKFTGTIKIESNLMAAPSEYLKPVVDDNSGKSVRAPIYLALPSPAENTDAKFNGATIEIASNVARVGYTPSTVVPAIALNTNFNVPDTATNAPKISVCGNNFFRGRDATTLVASENDGQELFLQYSEAVKTKQTKQLPKLVLETYNECPAEEWLTSSANGRRIMMTAVLASAVPALVAVMMALVGI